MFVPIFYKFNMQYLVHHYIYLYRSKEVGAEMMRNKLLEIATICN